MSVKKKIEEHALVVVVVAAVAAAGVVAGAMQYLHTQRIDLADQKHELEVSKIRAEYEEKLQKVEDRVSSIERKIGDKRLFNAESFVVTPQRMNSLSDNTTYFDKGKFYAPINKDHWDYRMTNQLDFMMENSNINPAEINQKHIEQARSVAVYLWKDRSELKLPQDHPLKKVFCHIAVRRLPHDMFLGELENKIPDISALLNSPSDDIKSNLEKYYRGDSVGFYLANFLQGNLLTNLSTNGTRTLLQSIQKTGNILHLQMITVFSDIVISDSHYDNYFVSTEMLLVSTREAIYVVDIVLPGVDPRFRDPRATWINEWLADFAVVVE